MTTKATVEEVVTALPALTRIFSSVKLGADATWDVSRLISKLQAIAKDFERAQVKLYLDAGGQHVGNQVVLNGFNRGENESAEAWEQRTEAHRQKVNKLHSDVQALLDKMVEISRPALSRSIFPKSTLNEKGETVPVVYDVADFINAGPFIVDDATAET